MVKRAMLKRVVHSLGLVENTDKDPRTKDKERGAKSSSDFSLQSEKIFVRIVHQGGKVEQYPHTISAARLMDKYPGMCIALPEVFKSPHNSVLWPEQFLFPGQKYLIISSRAVEKLKRKYPGGRTTEPDGVADDISEAMITKSPGQHKVNANGSFKVPNGMSQEILEAKSAVSPGGSKISPGGSKISPGGSKSCPGGSNVSPGGCKNSPGGSQKTLGGRKIEDIAKTQGAKRVGQDVDAVIKHCQVDVPVEDHCYYAKDFYASKEKRTKCSKRKGIKGKKPFVPPLPNAKQYRLVGWQPSLTPVQELSP